MSGIIETLEIENAPHIATDDPNAWSIRIRLPRQAATVENYDHDYHKIYSSLRRLKLGLAEAKRQLPENDMRALEKHLTLENSLSELEKFFAKILELIASGMEIK